MVHTVSSNDPLADLPVDTARAMALALLRPTERDLEAALERCEAVCELVERWQDAFFAALPDEIDLEDEARWAAEAGLSLAELEAAYDDEDDLEDTGPVEAEPPPEPLDLEPLDLEPLDLEVLPGHGEVTGQLPEELVTLLERELLLLPLRVRLEALVAAAALVGTWVDLLLDHEKMLGHLVLGHLERGVPDSHARLAGQHASLHAAHGPGHPEPVPVPDE